MECTVNHPSRWLRNVFRHYIQYLCYRGEISLKTFGWLVELKVPGVRCEDLLCEAD